MSGPSQPKKDSTRQTLRQFREKYGEKVDVFGVLQLGREATEKEITKAYKKLALLYHPDKQVNKDATMFNKIKEARDLLLDEAVREEISRESKRQKAQEEFLNKAQDERGKMARDLERRERVAEERRKGGRTTSMAGTSSGGAGMSSSSTTAGTTATEFRTVFNAEELSKIREQNRRFIEEMNEKRKKYLREELDVKVMKERVNLRDARVTLQVKRKNFSDLEQAVDFAENMEAGGGSSSTFHEAGQREGEPSSAAALTNASKRRVTHRIQRDFEELARQKLAPGFEGTVRLFDGVDNSASGGGATFDCEVQFESRDAARQCVEFLLSEKAAKKKFPLPWISKMPKLVEAGKKLTAADVERVSKRRKLFPTKLFEGDEGQTNLLQQAGFEDGFGGDGGGGYRYASFFAMEKDVLERVEAVLV